MVSRFVMTCDICDKDMPGSPLTNSDAPPNHITIKVRSNVAISEVGLDDTVIPKNGQNVVLERDVCIACADTVLAPLKLKVKT